MVDAGLAVELDTLLSLGWGLGYHVVVLVLTEGIFCRATQVP